MSTKGFDGPVCSTEGDSSLELIMQQERGVFLEAVSAVRGGPRRPSCWEQPS